MFLAFFNVFVLTFVAFLRCLVRFFWPFNVFILLFAFMSLCELWSSQSSSKCFFGLFCGIYFGFFGLF